MLSQTLSTLPNRSCVRPGDSRKACSMISSSLAIWRGGFSCESHRDSICRYDRYRVRAETPFAITKPPEAPEIE